MGFRVRFTDSYKLYIRVYGGSGEIWVLSTYSLSCYIRDREELKGLLFSWIFEGIAPDLL